MIATVIPLIGSDPQRYLNYQFTSNRYDQLFPVYKGTAATIGGARNVGALHAIKEGATHLFFCDSDMVIDPKNVQLAADISDVSHSAVYPYSTLTRLNKGGDRELRSGKPPAHYADGHPEAGALVIRSEDFIKICGYPQISWGEDNILHNVASKLLGPIVRIWSEPAYHLFHESSNHRWDARIDQVVKATYNASVSQTYLLIRRSKYYDIPTFEKMGFKPGG